MEVGGLRMKEVKITLVKSVIGHPKRQKYTVKSLGLNKIGSSVIKNKTPDIEGKVKKVAHLVTMEEL